MSMSEWSNQFDDWSCSVKNGLIEEIYQNDDMFFNFHDVEDHNDYNMLCSFDYSIALTPENHTLHILFPNCQFSSENELMVVQLTRGDTLIDGDNYQINFAQQEQGVTGTDINHDQNMKMAFFMNLISNDAMNIQILDVDSADISLDALQKGMSSPLCG